MSNQKAQFLSCASWVTNKETFQKNFYKSITETPTRRKRKNDYYTGNCKAFHVNTQTRKNVYPSYFTDNVILVMYFKIVALSVIIFIELDSLPCSSLFLEIPY